MIQADAIYNQIAWFVAISMTRPVRILLGMTVALIALMSLIALTSVALYYLVNIREANELLLEADRANAVGDYDFAIAQ